MKVPKA